MNGRDLLGGIGGAGHRPAVVVVDETIAFTDPSSPLCCDWDGRAVAATVRVVDSARRAGVPVVFSSVVVGPSERLAAAHLLRKMPGLLTIAAVPGREQIDPRLARRPEEPVIEKIFPSVFFGTTLATMLVGLGVDTVVITGMSTSGCVRATTVDALQHGFRPLVVGEAVADRDPAAHTNSLRDLRLKYADVVDLDDILGYLGGTAEATAREEQLR